MRTHAQGGGHPRLYTSLHGMHRVPLLEASLCMCAFVGLCMYKVMAYLIEAFMSIYACMSCVGFYVIPFGGNTVLCNGGNTHITDFFCVCN